MKKHYVPKNSQKLKAIGIREKLLKIIASVAINNPDKNCLLQNGRPATTVSPHAANMSRSREFVNAFTNASIYNLIMIGNNEGKWTFLAKTRNGDLVNSEVSKHIDGGYVSLVSATGIAILDIIEQMQNPNFLPVTIEQPADVEYPDTPINADSSSTEKVLYATEEPDRAQPQNLPPNFMRVEDMPPGLADAIAAAGIQMESYPIPDTEPAPVTFNRAPDIEDAVFVEPAADHETI